MVVLFAIQAPMRDDRVRETDAKKVDAVTPFYPPPKKKKNSWSKEGNTNELCYLHSLFNPIFLVNVLKAKDCFVGEIEVSIEDEEMVSKHEEYPIGD
ncbi:hypothetical protein RHGRI_004716 [Rhododendron griersonianum]|uniref:Uncharacterized protein n=1 Tax=Rhododendron griersonianum TaxID=479676 RepID=A0AAV6LAG0_9ERIC|nr:hypothetical protein RHGRI_004716 [Rhododendron griersonianum]